MYESTIFCTAEPTKQISILRGSTVSSWHRGLASSNKTFLADANNSEHNKSKPQEIKKMTTGSTLVNEGTIKNPKLAASLMSDQAQEIPIFLRSKYCAIGVFSRSSRSRIIVRPFSTQENVCLDQTRKDIGLFCCVSVWFCLC